MSIRYDSIKGMNCFVYNEAKGRYEKVEGFLSGKTSAQVADEHGSTRMRARQFGKERKLPYLGFEDLVHAYIYDHEAEMWFVNRPRKSTGRPPSEKPKEKKAPGKPGRPRKERPINTGPKNPVGRPRKHPKEGVDVVSKGSRKRPKKKRR